MGSNPPPSGPPPKPWERAGGTSSGPAPFRPPSSGNTSEVVEASGTAKPGEIVSTANATANRQNLLTRPVPSRPWEQNNGNSYGGYGSNLNYNSGYGSNMYGGSYGGVGGSYGGLGGSYGGLGGSYGGLGGSYGGGLYGNNSMYGRPYGGLSGGSGMYGGGMYNSGFGGAMGGYGMGMAGPYGDQDPNNPYGPPPSPPGFWMSFLRVMSGAVNFFGRISVLIDQNTQAFHMFMSALLQLFDRSGMLYGELARFVFRLLGIRTKSRKQQQVGPPGGLPGLEGQPQNYIEGPTKAPTGAWDNVWGDDGAMGTS